MGRSSPTASAEDFISDFLHNILVLGAGFVDMMIPASYMGLYIPWFYIGLAFCISCKKSIKVS